VRHLEKKAYAEFSRLVIRSESPWSVTDMTEQRKNFPQAVPRSLLPAKTRSVLTRRLQPVACSNNTQANAKRTASEVVSQSLGKHGVVLNLRLAQGRAVVGDEHELGWRKHKHQTSMSKQHPIQTASTTTHPCQSAESSRWSGSPECTCHS